MKGNCLAPGKGGVWQIGLNGLHCPKFHFFSFSLYSLVGHVENRRFTQSWHSKVSLFQGQNTNKHAGSSVSRISRLLLSSQLSAVTVGISSVSHSGLLSAEWVSRWAEFSPLLRISELVRSKYGFSWSLIPKSNNSAPWLPAWTSPQRVQRCFCGLAHCSWVGLSFFLPEFPTSWFLTLTSAKWQGHW